MFSSYVIATIATMTFVGIIVCSHYTSSLTTSYTSDLINIKYDVITKTNDAASLNKITSISGVWRQPQPIEGNLPSNQTLRSNSVMTPTSLPMNADEESHDFMDIQADIQRHRRAQLKDGCSEHHVVYDHGDNVLDNIIVDEKYKLVYCYVAKVACTSWKRVFLVLNGVMNQTDDLPQNEVNNEIGPRKLSFLKSYNTRRRAEILQNYTKFLVVRHPFERLLSAYRNKLWAGSTSLAAEINQRNYGLYILKKYRPETIRNKKGGSVEHKLLGKTKYDLRFDEFLKFLTNEKEKAIFRTNEHWREINRLCLPCQIDYDIISRFETVMDDARYILRQVHADDIVGFPSSKGSSPTNSSSTSIYESSYADIPRSDLDKLYQKYRLDFELFGYEKPGFIP